MNIGNGGLGFTQTLDNEDFKRKLRESMKEVNGFSAKSVTSMDSIQVKASDLAKGIGAIFTVGAATNFIQEMVKVRGEFEQLEIAFTTMLGSKERADNLMMEIVDFAAKTPFGLQSTSEATKMLLAYGESAETALETMRKLGDIASGVGIPLKDIAYLYGTTMTQGRLYTQDLNQFLGRGIPMMDELAKIFNVNKNEVKALVEEGKVGFPEVQKVIENLTTSGSMFGGLMEAQSKSIAGQIEQLKDAFDVMLNDLGKKAQPIVADLINGASSVVENYKEIGSVLTSLIATYGAYKTAVVVMSAANTSFLSSMDKIEKYGDVGAKRLIVSYNLAKATLDEAKAQDVLSKTQLNSARSANDLAKEADKKALAELNSAHALRKAAGEEVAAAQKKYDAYKGSHFIKKENQALTELEIAKEKELAAVTNVQTASENKNTTAKKVNTTQQSLQSAATERQTTKKAVAAATTNLETAATNRLTFAQRMNVAWTELVTIATNAWNASLLSNPIVLVIAAIAGLTTAYFLLRDTTTEAEKAQEKFNESQKRITDAVENTKKKAEEYISVLKDETATVYQQIKAYEALQALRLQGLSNLSQEQIQKMDLTEINKLLNQSMDSTSLQAQKDELNKFSQQIEKIKKQIQDLADAGRGGDINTGVLKQQLKEVTAQYEKQLDLVSKIEKEQYIANLPLKDKAKYWEIEIQRINEAINEIEKSNVKHTETKKILGTNIELSNILKATLSSVSIAPLLNELEQAEIELGKLKPLDVNSKIKNKDFYSNARESAEKTLYSLDLDDPKNIEKIKSLRFVIDGATKALDKYNQTKKATTLKTKTTVTKKADDPLEIFKKEVSTYKEQYDKLAKYAETKDLALVAESAKLKIVLSGKGATYLDFLKKQQEQLRESAKTSEIAQKKLSVINAEVYSLLETNGFELFKTNFDQQLDNAEYLIDKIKLINEEKAKLEGNTDQGSIDRLKFLNEKDSQNQLNVDRYLKDEGKKFDEQYQYLKVMREAYDADMLLLQDRYNKASNDAEKQRFQGLIALRSSQYYEDTNGKFESAEVNQILEEFKTLEQKKLDIASLYDGKKAKLRAEINSTTTEDELKLLTDAISEIERKQTEALNAIDKEILAKSKVWVDLFSDYANKSSSELVSIIKEAEDALNNPEVRAKMDVTEIETAKKKIKEAKDYLSKEDPFASLYVSLTNFKDLVNDDGSLNFDGIRQKITELKNNINSIFDIAEGLGISVSESTRDAVQLGAELFQAGTNIAQGIMTGKPLEVVKGVVQGITSIINAGDRKKERQIQKYKQAVQELTRAFDQLQRSADKALGGDVYKDQEQMIKNLQQQQEQYRKMIDAEKGKKKTDNGKISEYEQAIIDAGNRINDIMDDISERILQTTAKSLSNTLGDALVEAFSKGEDAAKSFEKVANDVLKNAVLNQLKERFLESKLQEALDGLQEQMGVTGLGWNGLTAEQQQQFRDKIADISAGFTGALDAYADLFKDLEDADANSLSGAIKGVSEETASLIAGQMNAIRIMQAEVLNIHRNSNAILVQQLDQLFRIEFNTRSITPMLERIHNVLNTESSRGWGH